MTRFIACAVVASAGSVASASLMVEAEPNDSTADANFVAAFTPPGGAVAIDGTITPGDVDWFEFSISAQSTLLITALGSTSDPLDADGQFQLLDSASNIIEFDDDDGPGFLPAINITGLAAGTYFLGVSGFPDGSSTSILDGLNDDTGESHQQNFEYKIALGVNLVPAPGAATLAAFAGLAAVRRRR